MDISICTKEARRGVGNSFFTSNCLFQIVPASFIILKPFILKPYDWVLLIIVVHFVIYFLKIINYKNLLTWPLRLFVLYLIGLLIYTGAVLNVDFKIALSVFRNYSFLLCPVIFINYEYFQMIKSLKIICFFTVLTAFIYIIQGFIGQPLLSSSLSDDVNFGVGSAGITRYYNLPFYTVFSLFYYANQFFKKTNPMAVVPILILFGAIVISFNRNTEGVVLFGLIFIFFHKKKVTLLNIAVIVVIGISFYLVTSSYQAEKGKYETTDLKAMADMDRLKDPSRVDARKISTFRFRILHFYERYLYIYNSSSVNYLTGIGLVTDQFTPIKQKLNFNIGTGTGKNNEKGEIDTSDIVWSLFILQTGMIGTLLFLTIIINYIINFFKQRSEDIFF